MAQTLTTVFQVGECVRVRGARWSIAAIRPFSSCASVRLEDADDQTNGRSRVLLLPFDRLERLHRPTAPHVVSRRRGLHAIARIVAGAHPYGGLRSAAWSHIDLHPFQIEPALAVCHGATSRILLADEVGLGKTIQAGLVLTELQARGRAARTLIVVPAGMRDQWAIELSSHFGLSPRTVDLASLAAASCELPAGLNPWSIPGVTIVSVDFIKRPEVWPALSELVWDVLILDEAHHLAPRTERAEAAQTLAARSRVVVLLTATPHNGDDRAFASLCGIGAHSTGDRSIVMFRRSREEAGFPADRRLKLLQVTPTHDEQRMYEALAAYVDDLWLTCPAHDVARASELRLLISVLRKRAFSSAASLHASVVRRRDLLDPDAFALFTPQPALPFESGDELDDLEPRVLGARGLGDARQERSHLDALAAAAQQAAHTESKLRMLRRLLRRTPERAIVFTEYRDTLQRIAAALESESLAMLHGGMTARERRAAGAQFKGGRARVLLATDAAGEGLNLHQDCRLVVSFELPWSPLRLEQRIGRVDRIGQARRVHAVAFLARGTAESAVHARLIAKAAHARQSLGFADESAHPPFRTLDLRQEAMAECARLAISRGFASANRGAASTPHPPLVIRPRRRARNTCIALYRVRLHDGAGAVLEDLLLPVQVREWPTPRRGSNSQLRESARTLLQRHACAIDSALAGGVTSRLGDVRRLHSTTRRADEAGETSLCDFIERDGARARFAIAQQSLFHRRPDELAADDRVDRLKSRLDDLRTRLARFKTSHDVHADPPELIAIFPI